MKDTKIEDRKPEIWKDIKEYEGLYKISSWGNVKSFHKSKKGKILSTCLRNTYVSLQLSKNRKKKNFDIHRLVGIHFIPNPFNKSQINHKNGNKENNYYEDLEWMTYEENIDHAFKNNLHNKPRKKVYCPELNEEFLSLRKASKKIGIKHQYISECCKGKRKSAGEHPNNKNIKLTWKYIN
jgi:hypothetical protein